MTNAVTLRFASHKTLKFSGRKFEMRCLARVPDYESAVAMEAEMIRTHRPPENVVHNPSARKSRVK